MAKLYFWPALNYYGVNCVIYRPKFRGTQKQKLRQAEILLSQFLACLVHATFRPLKKLEILCKAQMKL
jgi:hypothetical protein